MAIRVSLENYNYSSEELAKTIAIFQDAITDLENATSGLDYRVLSVVGGRINSIKKSLYSLSKDTAEIEEKLLEKVSQYKKIEEKNQYSEDIVNSIATTLGVLTTNSDDTSTSSKTKESSNVFSWIKDKYQEYQATKAVVATSVVSGIANIGEGIADGLTWTGGKIVEGGSWVAGKVVGWFSDDAESAVMEWRETAKQDIKVFIGTDWVGLANQKFYEETELGRRINEKSAIKYNSEIAQSITSVTETAGKFALATAATCIPGVGAVAAPLILGFTSGVGEQSETLYKDNPNTTGTQELGIFVSGLGEAANWYAMGKLGKSGLDFANIVKQTGLKNTGALLINGAKNIFSNIQNNGISNTLKGIFKSSKATSLIAADNLSDSVGIIGDNVSDWLIGNEKFTFNSALDAVKELGLAWGANMLFDGAGQYLQDIGSGTKGIIPNSTDLTIDNKASLSSRFEEFAIEGSTDYGIDQAACRRLTYNQRLNNDWIQEPEEFREFIVEKFPDMSPSEVDSNMKVFMEKDKLNNNCKSVIIEYLQKKHPDYQSALEAYNHSFSMMKKEGYDNIINKYMKAGMSEAEATYLLSHIDTVGVCSYAAQANGIASSFINNPTLFRETFGYDLFLNVDGKQVLNSGELLSDLYVYSNLDTNGGKLFTIQDGKLTYLTKDFSKQTYLSGGYYTRDDIIDGFLKSKSPNFGFSDNIRLFSNSHQGIIPGASNSTGYTVDDIKKIFGEVLLEENNVQLSIYRTPHNQFTFYNMDGSVNVTTNSWSEGGGHAVFITGIDDDGIIVSSWGEKLKIKYEDFINNRYNISWGTISGVNPTVASTAAISTPGVTKMITDGVGDEAIKNSSPYLPIENIDEIDEIIDERTTIWVEDADDVEEYFGKWGRENCRMLDEDTKEAIRFYKDQGYTSINGELRRGKSSVFKKEIDAISAAINGSRIPYDITVHRAMNLESFMKIYGIEDPNDLAGLVGLHYRDAGFTSTTVLEWEYNTELYDTHFKDMDVQISINIPEGTPGLYIQSLGKHEFEYELLLDKGEDFVIGEVMERDGKWYIYMVKK